MCEEYSICKKCGSSRPKTEYICKTAGRNPTTHSYCRECRLAYVRQYRKDHKHITNIKLKEKRKQKNILLEIAKNNNISYKEFKKEYNKSVVPFISSERKRKYFKSIHLKNVIVKEINPKDKIVIIILDDQNLKYLENIYNDFVRDFKEGVPVTEMFILDKESKEIQIIGIFYELLILDNKYNEIYNYNIIGEPVDIIGNLIMNYNFVQNSAILTLRYVKELPFTI